MDRPLYHFTPERGWINDPNGLVYYDGEYHLFFQYDPHSAVGGGARMHWGHAVSTDLVSWTPAPVALAPDPLGTIWSGSAVVDRDDTSGFFGGGSGLVSLYTQWRPEAQVQSLAYSVDRGQTWIKSPDNPIIVAPDLRDFRDPKVFWHAPSERWIMVVTIGQRVRFYRSPNLREWQATGEFGAGYGSQGGVWECPDLFPLALDGSAGEERWVLLISIGGPDGSRMEYFIGAFDGETFISENPAATVLPFDYGRDCYAAVTWSDVPPEDGRRIAIGWMNNWRYARQMPGEIWRGAMTLPRELRLVTCMGALRLIQRPVIELGRLRHEKHRWPTQTIEAGTTLEPPLRGEALEIVATFGAGTAREFGFVVRGGDERGATVGYDATTEHLFIERGGAGNTALDRFGGRQEALLPRNAADLTLHIFIDRCSIEVFADGGAVILTDLFFPASGEEIELYTRAGDVELRELMAYRLGPVQ
jgi:fructan beta-fructosidase